MIIQFTDSQIAIMEEALSRWGAKAQAGQAVEELAELIAALMKHTNRAPKAGSLDNVIDEMADVEMMLAQMRLVYRISDEQIRDRISVKFEKLQNIMREERTGFRAWGKSN